MRVITRWMLLGGYTGLAAGVVESLSHLVHHALFGDRIPLGLYPVWSRPSATRCSSSPSHSW